MIFNKFQLMIFNKFQLIKKNVLESVTVAFFKKNYQAGSSKYLPQQRIPNTNINND